MEFKYVQSTGEFFHGDTMLVKGYSGHETGVNNPAMQDVHMVGPLPCGVYTISQAHDDAKVGPMAMRLVPAAENEMFGRGDFLIHGDNAAMNHTASEGCIILRPDVRRVIAKFVSMGQNQLQVVAEITSEATQ